MDQRACKALVWRVRATMKAMATVLWACRKRSIELQRRCRAMTLYSTRVTEIGEVMGGGAYKRTNALIRKCFYVMGRWWTMVRA